MVCGASGNYGISFLAGCGITQGSQLSTRTINILVDAIARKCFWALQGAEGYNDDKVGNLMATFFTIFYINGAYLASRDADFLQRPLNLLIDLYERVGLKTNTSNTQTMI
jgi:hypothetical protein